MSLILDGTGTISGLNAGGLPSATVTQATLATPVAGTGPAFSAYQSSAQSLSASTWTKLQFQTEEFDTNNNFDSTTNYRFTPTVAGYYQVIGCYAVLSVATGASIAIYKNGTVYKSGSGNPNSTTSNTWQMSALVYLNGSTDYVEVYGYISAAQSLLATAQVTYFQASMVRSV
jgi:hypothetical protein